ncbi:L-fuconolactonase [Kribbella sp. VKM Ac-2569]|uniref:amidohydrolase family protein n=1 Tax=Kribbella sp. VKM Ac-2569 TaxID=2512220 RepID=UPI00102D23C1|nr:amidohydrolase family protein [Kribbella sp. VKM Ac-2569]RZT16727.1 L-fuconolactonase [Kribbella sp. VKM Ac-2569]
MIIDAHQHVWDLDRSPYRWLGPHVPQWNRTFTFEELKPQLVRNGVDATVLVQSDDHDGDTDLMLEVADRHPEVAAIVAYVPLDQPGVAAERLAQLRKDPRVVGIRNLIHDLPDPDWILRPDVGEGLGVLEQADVTFDYVAVLPRHLEHVPTLSERHPELRIVIDHLAKPPIGDAEREPWWSLIATAAENPRVYAKVSGLYPETWTRDSLQPFLDRALEVFGPERLMYGGDWPISTAAGGYDRVFKGLSDALSHLSDSDREHIYSATARRFYRINGQA